MELTGRTQFYYEPARGGRIVAYRETWDISAGEALMQLVRPWRHSKKSTTGGSSGIAE